MRASAMIRGLRMYARLNHRGVDTGRTQVIATPPASLSRVSERGLLVRPLGSTIYVMPPYCSTASDLDLVYDAIDELAVEVA